MSLHINYALVIQNINSERTVKSTIYFQPKKRVVYNEVVILVDFGVLEIRKHIRLQSRQVDIINSCIDNIKVCCMNHNKVSCIDDCKVSYIDHSKKS